MAMYDEKAILAKSDSELLTMLGNPKDYLPEVVALVETELRKRSVSIPDAPAIETRASTPESATVRHSKQPLATGAWVCPVLAWVVTSFSAAVGKSAGFVGNALLALTQLGLLVAGLVLGIIVLADREARGNRKAKRSAIVGLVLSGGTFVFVALAVIMIVVSHGTRPH